MPERAEDPTQSIASLPAGYVATLARECFIVQGRSRLTAALTYHALELEPWDPTALETLSGYLDEAPGGQIPASLKPLSAAVLEYALGPASLIAPDERRGLDEVRFRTIWFWGFAKHHSGAKQLKAADFADRSAFDVDASAYQAFWRKALEAAGSLEACFAAAQGVVGLLAGFLDRIDSTREASICGAYPREALSRNEEAYQQWLDFDRSLVDRVHDEVERLRGRGSS